MRAQSADARGASTDESELAGLRGMVESIREERVRRERDEAVRQPAAAAGDDRRSSKFARKRHRCKKYRHAYSCHCFARRRKSRHGQTFADGVEESYTIVVVLPRMWRHRWSLSTFSVEDFRLGTDDLEDEVWWESLQIVLEGYQ